MISKYMSNKPVGTEKVPDFFPTLLQKSTSGGIMSAATEQGVFLMNKMSNAAQFYFSYYYFFPCEK